MKELELFYNSYYKAEGMPPFDELDAGMIETLKGTYAFARFKLQHRYSELKDSIRKEIGFLLPKN